MNSIPKPGDFDAPKYWQHESSGRLKGPISRYLNNESLSADDILCIRAYLRQWIDSRTWDMNPAATGEDMRVLAELRARARQIKNRLDIDQWVWAATEWGMDPL